jgi:stage II sporulation protein D
MYDRKMRALAAGILGLLAVADVPLEPTVTASLFSKLNPHRVRVEGPIAAVLEAQGGALRVNGKTVRQPYRLPEGDWKLTPKPGDTRALHGSLAAWAEAGEVELVASLALEDYVAEAVASETVPWTPDAALQAQAIVTRSWVLASGDRHARARVCDHAHCQVLLRRGVSEHRPRCRGAAEATRGCVLRLADGAVAVAVYHAACGGATEDPALVFGAGRQRTRRPHPTGAVSLRDPGCPPRAWQVLVPLADFERELGRVLGLPQGARAALSDVELVRGPGGRIVVVRHRPSGRFGSGDALARALDRPEGWGHVWSARFDVHPQGSVLALHGTGYGHGVGLCQTGAAVRARRGEDAATILRAYFPDARVGDD